MRVRRPNGDGRPTGIGSKIQAHETIVATSSGMRSDWNLDEAAGYRMQRTRVQPLRVELAARQSRP